MRLNSIKLAGFKSFVDPTQLLLQSNLTAIVGPNGCGKSNIVDAIHCVLGSTSKNLRAEMMADVIFNGTTSRKPVGQASIELVFDNGDGRIGGEYAQYPEISIRRELGRDGLSNYYLNGTRCRRRDITDIFLGTGLGNNSYAIIEQGMISRLIEAKPEELRAHVEEAAGTSKYKERRRETENRIKHTRENLDRLNDLREEQGKQLSHLQRQANAAERFKTLKSEQRLVRAQLQTILWQGLQQKIISYDQKIATQETALEAKIAELRSVDKEIEFKRSSRGEHNDALNEVQARYYSLGSEISRIEQTIAHAKERRKQLETDYGQLEHSFHELKEQQFEDENQLQEVSAEIANIEASFQTTKEQSELAQKHLKIAEEKMHMWQEAWDEFNQNCAHISKLTEVERTKIQHLEQKQAALQVRLAKIKEEQNNQASEQLVAEVAVLHKEQKNSEVQVEILQEQLDALQNNIQLERTRSQEIQLEVAQFTKELRDLQARQASMQALQQIALGKSNSDTINWLNKNALQGHQRLVESFEVEVGFEIAAETVLADHLDAICISDFKSLSDAIGELNNADVTFFNLHAPTEFPKNTKPLPFLKDKVVSKLPLSSLLNHIYVANDLNQALEELPNLSGHESIVTKDGIWVSHSWLKVTRIATEKTGVVQREHELKDLHAEIVKHQERLHKQETLLQSAQEQLNIHTEERETLQHQLQVAKARNSDLVAQIKAKENYIQQLQQKQTSLSAELNENEEQFREVTRVLQEAQEKLLTVSQQSEDETQKRQGLLEQREELRFALDETRKDASLYRQKVDESQVRMESMRSQMHYLSQNMSRVERQLASINERKIQLDEALNNINDPIPELNVTLQQTLEKRALIEEELSQARQTMALLENSLQELEKNRQHIENQCQEIRSQLEQIRLDCQAFKVKLATHEEQIVESGFELEQLKQALPEEAKASDWEDNLAKIDNRIQRLGPINLAAIEEYKELSERKEYLDKQHNDLLEALETLENAIRKIDKETRIRFKETFTQLNDSFKTYFHQIFGGGEANLELTSDDLLETGVIVKAQPPGKRNSTIHLLSGGEKALTAIALVFAIFSLNPAPFCVLDEVDAPLDDVNVGRFCNLVRKMSEKIQFIFISHNKITIEMGQQLAGVTMNEPGVSRLVSVDVEQAISMATA